MLCLTITETDKNKFAYRLRKKINYSTKSITARENEAIFFEHLTSKKKN